MTTCPNCGRQISDADQVCPNCHFNLQKYRETFFTDRHQPANYETDQTGEKIASREVYRQEFYPQKQNLVVKKMLEWMHVNSMIVFLLGILLLIIMSFSRMIGWISFFALLVWLYLVCLHNEKIERYTVDKRLTEKVNQLGSKMFNDVEESRQKVRSKTKMPSFNKEDAEQTIEISKKHFNYVQLMVILMAVINLIVLFAGSGASISDVTYNGKVSITRLTFRLAGHLFSSSATLLSGILVCLIWLLVLAFPILIGYNTLKNTKKSRLFAFVLSLIETVFLFYIVYRMSNSTLSHTGFLHSITSELLVDAVSIGTSTYFLILASFMTTLLSGYNLFKKQKEQ